MSHAYVWLRLYNEARRDPKIRKMPLEQKAVFYQLLQLANEQDERGTFSDADRMLLALDVADEREDVLDLALSHLLTYGVLERRGDGLLTFTGWEKFQSVSPDLHEKRVEAGRKGGQAKARASSDASHKHGLASAKQTGANLAEEIRGDKRKEETTTRGEEDAPAVDEVERVFQILNDAFKIEHPRSAHKTIREAIAKYPDVDPIITALEAVEWQREEHTKKLGGKPHKFRSIVLAWVQNMHHNQTERQRLRTPSKTPIVVAPVDPAIAARTDQMYDRLARKRQRRELVDTPAEYDPDSLGAILHFREKSAG